MMKNYDQSVEINQNPNWLYIPDHPYIILIIGGSGSCKTNALLNLLKNQRPNWSNLFSRQGSIWIKESTAYQWKKKVEIKKLKNSKAFIDYSQTIVDVYENLEDNNPIKEGKVLIVFNDTIADM